MTWGHKTGGQAKRTPNKRVLDMRAMALSHADEAYERIVSLMRAEDYRVALSAAQFIIDRAYGKGLPARTFIIDLPEIETLGGIRGAIARIVRAVASGEITTGEAHELIRILEIQAKVAAATGEQLPE